MPTTSPKLDLFTQPLWSKAKTYPIADCWNNCFLAIRFYMVYMLI